MSGKEGHRRCSATSLDVQPLHQWTSLNANETEMYKTTKLEEENRLCSENFITGNQQMSLLHPHILYSLSKLT